MNPSMKGSVIMFFLLLTCLSAGVITASGVGTNPVDFLHKGRVRANPRKLMGFNAVLDYDYAGPNPKHDPRGGKKGGGGRNP